MARFEAERLGGDAAGLFSAQRRQLRGRLPRLLQTVVRGLAWGNVRCRACAEIAFRPAALAGSGRAAPTLCAECAFLLRPRLAGYCLTCGQLFPNAELPPGTCAGCLCMPPPWASLYFFAGYEQLVRELFTAFKFHGDLAAGKLLSQLLSAHAAPTLAADLALNQVAGARGSDVLLVPVPVHKKRLQERGFNQSLLLARPLAAALGLRLAPQALWRTRLDPPQSSLGRVSRLAGPKGAFAAHAMTAGRRIVLLDDVMTTGATLREATRVLLKQGALEVRIVVLARTPFASDAS